MKTISFYFLMTLASVLFLAIVGGAIELIFRVNMFVQPKLTEWITTMIIYQSMVKFLFGLLTLFVGALACVLSWFALESFHNQLTKRIKP